MFWWVTGFLHHIDILLTLFPDSRISLSLSPPVGIYFVSWSLATLPLVGLPLPLALEVF